MIHVEGSPAYYIVTPHRDQQMVSDLSFNHWTLARWPPGPPTPSNNLKTCFKTTEKNKPKSWLNCYLSLFYLLLTVPFNLGRKRCSFDCTYFIIVDTLDMGHGCLNIIGRKLADWGDLPSNQWRGYFVCICIRERRRGMGRDNLS